MYKARWRTQCIHAELHTGHNELDDALICR